MPRAKKKQYTSTFTYEGKRYYVRSAKSQREADRKAAERLFELKNNRVILSPETTVTKYADHWYETFVEGQVSDPVAKQRKARITTYLLPECGHMRLKDVRRSNLQKVLNAPEDMSRDFYVKLRSVIKNLFECAKDDRLILENPADKLELPESENGTNRSLTAVERQAVTHAMIWHSFGLFVHIMLRCGLRPQEVIVLRPEDIDVINRRINVRQALKADGEIGKTKSEKGVRSVPIPPDLWLRIKPRLKHDQNIVVNHTGKRYNRNSVRTGWNAFKREVDILLGAEIDGDGKIIESVVAEDLVPYTLRHTYCTDLQRAGVPINIARYLMGHSKIELTAKIYTHMDDETLDLTAAKIAGESPEIGATVGATPPPHLSAFTGKIGLEQNQAKRA